MKTVSAKKEEVTRQWYVVDAQDQTLGRLSTEIANRLRGNTKHRSRRTLIQETMSLLSTQTK